MSSTQTTANDERGDGEAEPDDPSPADAEIETDEIFHILQNKRRRLVLEYLQGADESVRMRDIAEQVAAWENGISVDELSSDARQRVYIPLYQSHLPKLDKAGVIDYQQNRGIVERKPLAAELDQYLDVGSSERDVGSGDSADAAEWDDYYIGAASVGAILLLGAVFELPIFSVITGVGLSALILLMFAVLTIGRYVD